MKNINNNGAHGKKKQNQRVATVKREISGADLVPVYRLKAGRPLRLMGWAERSDRLRGVIEIRMGDTETEVVFSQSDA